MMAAARILPFLFGIVMSVNFAIFWALPVMGMGALWKIFFKQFFLPAYTFLDTNKLVRSFASEYIYTKPEHADFFVTSVTIIVNIGAALGFVFYYQLSTGTLPAWLICAYYCSWVGIGGRTMGGAYALAHKEVRSLS